MKARTIWSLTLTICLTILCLSIVEGARQKDVHKQATLQKLKCEILLDVLPNPLTVRIVNKQSEEIRYSTFMSTHATMPPMPNVRVEVTDISSHLIRTCTPVVLTEKRSSFILKPGESKDLHVYHYGFSDLPQGVYEVTVMLFNDTDTKQETPMAVSPIITMKINPRADKGDNR